MDFLDINNPITRDLWESPNPTYGGNLGWIIVGFGFLIFVAGISYEYFKSKRKE